MKKILSLSVLGAVLALSLVTGTAGTSAQTATATATPAGTATPAPTAPPVQGNKSSVFMSVDTVQGAGGAPAPAVGCSQTNLFRQGQVVVFRMWGINAKLGGAALTPKNVKSALLNIPGVSTPIQMAYGAHGKAPNQVSFWSAPWKTTSATPLGTVNFTVVLKTKAVKFQGKTVKSMTAKFSQLGFSDTSRLTVTP